VLVNGDIEDVASAGTALLQSGASGVMAGRAVLGRPWLLGEMAAAVNGASYAPPSLEEKVEAIATHFSASLVHYGVRRGVLKFRKHLAAYFQHLGASRGAASAACRLDDPADVFNAISACPLAVARAEAA
jgi:tRNA-dihydrouridine synthase